MKYGDGQSHKSLKMCRVVTVPLTFSTLLKLQLKTAVENDLDVTLVSSFGEELNQVCNELNVGCHAINMTRRVSILQDLVAVWKLYRIFRLGKFDIVHSSTPKAGLLTCVAGYLARIPSRLHTYTGQPWVEMKGLMRSFARISDWVIGILNTRCYADSNSQRDFLIQEGIIQASKISVLASGSLSGVDLDRYDCKKWGGSIADETRSELRIPKDAVVIAFVGRLNRDKGVLELISAFELLDAETEVHLVLVGPLEIERDPLPQTAIDKMINHSKIHVIGFSHQPEKYLGIADIFCLPSYREGFGSVVIEAAAMGIPAVVTSVVGLVDAVVPDETGLIVISKDVKTLNKALSTLINNVQLREKLGKAARVRAYKHFDAHIVNNAVVNEYKSRYYQHIGNK